MEKTIHILTQFVWPDGAPTSLYASDLATELFKRGYQVKLVGGIGSYRERKSSVIPAFEIIRLDSFKGSRRSIISVAAEYLSVTWAFYKYIQSKIRPGDLVVLTSAPPITVFLSAVIRRRRVNSIYWLQDYYPELVRSIFNYGNLVERAVRVIWNGQLAKWEHVVKISSNLGYFGSNSVVCRNWPTLEVSSIDALESIALYSGNLGYAHDVGLLVDECKHLKSQGFRIRFRVDGPGVEKLPSWIEVLPPCADEDELIRELSAAKVHLVAAHPKFCESIFPSKYWNARATKTRIVCTGFVGRMQEELQLCQQLEELPNVHLLADILESILKGAPRCS